MATHTPGPWTIYVRSSKEGACLPGLWIRSDSRTVVDTGAIKEWPLSDADKSLISAAPDLLDACQLANAELLALGVGSSASPALRALWAAIAKADGTNARIDAEVERLESAAK